jgi:kynureninase
MASPTRADLARLDADDPLAATRARFSLPAGVIYLDGNSLGALPAGAAARVAEVVEGQWGRDLIRSWNTHGWIDAPHRLGARIAPLIGAQAHEVVLADSTTVNLFKLAAGALALRPGRTTVLAEAGNFPTDLHVLQGLEALAPGRVRLKTLAREALLGAIDEDVALVALTHVHYKSGERWPLAEVTARTHDAGGLMLWDLSHTAGALAIDLDAADADLAVGCGYKYLNGGPGAPSFVFVAQRLQQALRSPIWGWMGHAAPFEFGDAYVPADGVGRQLAGTPGILALAALEAGLATFEGVDMRQVEAKAARMGDLLIELVEARCGRFGLRLASPRNGAERGSHVSFAHPEGYAIMQALIARGVIGDFRAPDILRFGLTPLYLGYGDLWDAVEHLAAVLERGEQTQEQFRRRQKVT